MTSTAATTARPSVPEDGFVAAWESFFKAVGRARGRAGRVAEGELKPAQFNLLEALATTGVLARRRELVEATRRRIHDSLAPDESELAAGLLRRLSGILDEQA
jgi:hypothetical protein